MKKLLYIALMMAPLSSLGQETAPTAVTSIGDDPNLSLYIMAGLLLFTMVLVLLITVYLLQVLNLLARQAARDKAKKLGIEYKEEPGLWEQINQRLTGAVAVEKEATILMDHSYDGIRELDNHLPPWWKWLFYVTIVFSVVYLAVYHITDTMPLPTAEYEQELASARQEYLKLQAANPGPAIDENNIEVVKDDKSLADGKSTFTSICASCHRPDGGGDIGPNLTDEFWKHGGSPSDIFKVVKNGVPSTNMVAWGGSLSPEKIRNVTSYVLSLQGTKPVNGKKPEGTPYQAPAKADTVKTQGSM